MKSVLLAAFSLTCVNATQAYAADLLYVEGASAQATYDAMTVEGEFDGAYHTTKAATGEFECVERTPWGAPAFYWCDLGDDLHIEGQDASNLFEAFGVRGEFDGAYHTTKSGYGTLSCVVRTPWGAPSFYYCSFQG